MNEELDDGPKVIAPPALIVLVLAIIAILLDLFIPTTFKLGGFGDTLGGLVTVAGLAIILFSTWHFRRQGTNIPTSMPATTLFENGLYRYSRNPIYVGFVLVFIGLGLAIDNLWLVIAVIPFVVIIRFGVIAPEEAYLERKYGDRYREYARHVRRWL